MHGPPQLGWNKADHLGFYSELHLLRIDWNGKRQRCPIVAGDPAHYDAHHLRRHARQRGDDFTRAGVERCTCHMLRHTCLTRLREAGMALEAVQAQAGHRSIESTRIYLHLTNAWLADEYRRAADPIEASHRAELLAMQELTR